MRSAIVKLPSQRSDSERRQVFRAAIRQLERAELYFTAASVMDLGDRVAQRAIAQLRADLEALRRYLIDFKQELEA